MSADGNAAGKPAPADPIESHVAALDATLHGPVRLKARMMAEVREGLTDATAARTAGGMPSEHAAREAVREFGTAKELAPGFQRELTVAQTRHTARAVALTAPFLIICWLLIWTSDHGPGWQQPGAARLLTLPLAVVAVAAAGAAAAALLGLAALAATGTLARRLPTPRRLPAAVAWSGTAVGIAMALATLTLGVTSALTADWPLLACAGALTAASHGVVATSARTCRRCARLPAR
ncbi:permease prefix domain 1-containing protein [Streptomyces iconiensis]|uniref:Permease prefix domain 1-containing protein n=1 Tax=Streptomyces iconiensis TaxID=1384038 RepID=A0ABT7A9Z2_9ACTN|nr:permease prefix domain 1-containing protein [Streptomyces iconiensis]MDJ1138115.1 permease prefix domain 1-containing protein [Streptomyces iconiensis]